MILTRLRLDPFGFFSNREVRFTPGLNVVLGPNEAGKSTLFGAVRNILLRAKLKKGEFEKYLQRYLPAAGGDTLRVECDFQTGPGTYTLKRRWGARPASELSLPEGGAITDDEAVREKLEQILPVSPGTFWWVLMTGQAELSSTREAVTKGSTAASEFSDVLRAAVLDTGGVSADGFRELLLKRIEESDSRWDARARGPESGRGIANPWGNKVGVILKAWYAMEGLRSDRDAAEAFEREMDALNARLRAASEEASRVEVFVSTSRKAAEDAQERRLAEEKLKAVRAGMDALRKANGDWPVAEARRTELVRGAAGLRETLKALEKERADALKAERSRKLRESLGRASRLKARWEEAGKRLTAAGSISPDALDAIRKAAHTLELLAGSDEGKGITVTVKARSAVSLGVQEGAGPEEKTDLAAGKKKTWEVPSLLRIAHPDLEIEVRTGQGDPAAAQKELTRLLSRHGVSSAAEAEKKAEELVKLSAEERAAREALDEELGGRAFEELSKEASAAEPPAGTRPLAEVEGELARARAQADGAARETAELETRTRDYVREYGTPEKLLDALAERKGEEKALSARLGSLSPLPQGFTDAASFIAAYESARLSAVDLGKKVHALREEKAKLEGRAPETSAEELADQLSEAEAAYQAAEEKGAALRRVLALTESLLGGDGQSVYSGVQKELEELMSRMTEGRYGRVEMDGSLPLALDGGKGTLSWERLSTGTKDVLALALRLTMASRLLGKAPGFLMMDDPLVDMDPERQKAAAGALKAFARERQLIVFTCHPAHAELLGGTRIDL